MHYFGFRKVIVLLGFAAAICTACGCGGSSMIKVKGKVEKSGAPLAGGEGDLEISFTPYQERGLAALVYPAIVNADDSFEILGDDGDGIPPGKYRISIRHMNAPGPFGKDQLKGKFGLTSSPIVRDINSNTGEVLIDIDKEAKASPPAKQP